jgi:hypothetical protein
VRCGRGGWTCDNETGLFAVILDAGFGRAIMRQTSSRFPIMRQGSSRFRFRNLPVPSARLCVGPGSRRILLEAGLDVVLLAL